MPLFAMPASPKELFERLRKLDITTTTYEHPAVFTVAEAKQHRPSEPATHVKNLFLRNKKKKMWLVVAEEDRAIDLKALGKRIGAGHVSFARPERLMTYLGVTPGSVTPFALINAAPEHVSVVFDRELIDAKLPVHAHPLVNTMTTAIAPDDLLRFCRECGHEPEVVDLNN